ncbi:MAG: RES family NAD+ phosphorylase, partial [Gammaproteobacteria bacterium]|nr:RES family NAD+ phosphorylase [Gammaproteobacteria bacterium]
MAGRFRAPPLIRPSVVRWRRHYRLVASQHPPISLFEDYIDPNLMEAAFFVESRTNPRLRNEAGDITLVPKSEVVLGPGASPVMAAFTHIGHESRFNDGSFGIYYAADSI